MSRVIAAPDLIRGRDDKLNSIGAWPLSAWWCLPVLVNQPACTRFAQFQYAFKARQIAVIGVGHLARSGAWRVLQEQPQLVDMVARADTAQLIQIFLVHPQDQVVLFEILFRYLARAASAYRVSAP